ncbi:MAG: metallophosphoesterase, partial [Bacteroidota bacterium]
MRNSPFWWILFGFMVLLDVYCFQALKAVTQSASGRTRTIIHSGYWVLSVVAVILLIILPYLRFDKQAWLGRSTLFAMLAGLFFAKVIAAIFFLVDDMRRGVQWLAGKLFFAQTEGE